MTPNAIIRVTFNKNFWFFSNLSDHTFPAPLRFILLYLVSKCWEFFKRSPWHPSPYSYHTHQPSQSHQFVSPVQIGLLWVTFSYIHLAILGLFISNSKCINLPHNPPFKSWSHSSAPYPNERHHIHPAVQAPSLCSYHSIANPWDLLIFPPKYYWIYPHLTISPKSTYYHLT